ncbi:1-acyl-sn-glycerol-3-phosphate acyltransferase delta [Dissostichus eleginoides]|uniref:1-acyl-sn-glycerol-3-phosphate acyltransferase delta n=1 Tax=Dissostichus eleginoides TaxID=100907 RepID=A0AAD9CPY6_DISEL|nr:1-acyl-sn-glycerol-3-phosphate acyltransferase delta [Dissostichus eleginoides]
MGLIQLLKSHFLSHLIFCYVFLVSGLIVNLLQFCTLPLWLVSKKLARKINIRLCYCISSQLVVAVEWWSGTECTLYTDPKCYPLYGNENAIAVLNHCSEIDFLCGWTFCERFGVLGSSKVLAKKELKYLPIIGWMWYFLEIVFCKRKWEEDRRTVAESLQNLHDYPEIFWFLLFCEGTRFTPKKHEDQRILGNCSEPQRNCCSCVRLHTELQKQRSPTLLDILNGKKYHADLYVRRIPLELIPEGEAECAAWLHKLYQEKDSFQEHYTQKGCFPGPTVTHPRRPWALINWICWACMLLYPLGLLLVQLVSSGSILTILVSVTVACAASLGGRWMICQTETNRGSSYGNKEVPSKNN